VLIARGSSAAGEHWVNGGSGGGQRRRLEAELIGECVRHVWDAHERRLTWRAAERFVQLLRYSAVSKSE
jgi:hypothetical protein